MDAGSVVPCSAKDILGDSGLGLCKVLRNLFLGGLAWYKSNLGLVSEPLAESL
jgi:hypothetical protein